MTTPSLPPLAEAESNDPLQQFLQSPPPPIPTGSTDLSLPIQWIFDLDPLNLTEENLTSLVRYYRAERLNFEALEKRPKAIKSTRGPAMADDKAQEALKAILSGAIGGKTLDL